MRPLCSAASGFRGDPKQPPTVSRVTWERVDEEGGGNFNSTWRLLMCLRGTQPAPSLTRGAQALLSRLPVEAEAEGPWTARLRGVQLRPFCMTLTILPFWSLEQQPPHLGVGAFQYMGILFIPDGLCPHLGVLPIPSPTPQPKNPQAPLLRFGSMTILGVPRVPEGRNGCSHDGGCTPGPQAGQGHEGPAHRRTEETKPRT